MMGLALPIIPVWIGARLTGKRARAVPYLAPRISKRLAAAAGMAPILPAGMAFARERRS